MNSCASAALAACDHAALRSYFSIPYAMLLRDRVVEQKCLLRDQADHVPQRGEREFANVDAVDQNRARRSDRESAAPVRQA